MNSQELRALQEACSQVYELDERNEESYIKDVKKSERNPKKVEQQKTTHRKVKQNPLFFGGKPFGSLTGKMSKSPRNQKEEADLYDIILSYLLDEGYAETQEQAEVIMVNMSEDWRESIILEQSLPSNYTDYKSPAVQASHARSMGSASKMRQMGMNATSVDPKDDAQSNLNAVKSGNGVAKPLSGTTIRSGAGKGFKVGDPGINIGSSK